MPEVAVRILPILGREHTSVRVEVECEGIPSCFGHVLVANVADEGRRRNIGEMEIVEEILGDHHVVEALPVDLHLSLSIALAVLQKIELVIDWDIITPKNSEKIEN